MIHTSDHIRVAHSFPNWLPQTQTWMYSQVKELQRIGFESHVVCDTTENLDQFFVENIHSFADESFYKQLWQKGLRKLRLRRRNNYLAEICQKHRVDIVHSHFGNIGWMDLESVENLSANHVVTFYGYDVNHLPVIEPRWKARYRQLFGSVDLVLCEGAHMSQCVVALGCPEDKVKVQHLGVDVDNICFQPRRWTQSQSLRVLIAASFREKKGIPYALEALGALSRKVPIQLTIIGDAGADLGSQNEKEKILSALDRFELNESTRLLGYQSHQAMLNEAYAHHVFLQPSITAENGDTEGGAPVAIIEMLATGMPVVATDHCDIPEVVGPSFQHLLAPERDAEALAEKLEQLLNESENWGGMLQKTREYIEAEYHQVKQAEKLAALYLSIC